MGQGSSSTSNNSQSARALTSTQSPHSSNRSRPVTSDRRRTVSSTTTGAYRVKPSRDHSTSSIPVSWPHHSLLPLDSALQPANQDHAGNFQFNIVHGKNIVLSVDRKTASRLGSFCNALVFTHRAIHIGEILHYELIQHTSGWSGVLRFGYTSHDPVSLKAVGIPKYVCPDLTARQGNWAKALRESYAKHSNVLNFVLAQDGTVYFSVNQDPFMEFFNGVDTSRPVWGVIDIYGNTTGVRIVDTFPTSNRITTTRGVLNANCAELCLVSELVPVRGPGLSLHARGGSSSSSSSNPQPRGSPRPEPLSIHATHGHNIVLSEERTIADRKPTSVSGGIVFTSRPVECHEKVLIRILAINHCYIGHMAVGLTSCDPETLDDDWTLPLEAEDICDRKEYWVMTRDYDDLEEDACLGFAIGSDGRVHMVREPDTGHSKVLMHVDTSTPLWMFFDLYGTTQTIKILGVLKNTELPLPEPEMANTFNFNIFDEASERNSPMMVAATEQATVHPPAVPARKTTNEAAAKTRRVAPPRPAKGPLRQQDNECTVCFERPTDAVLYKCGHVCCCLVCARKLKERGDPCPLCRAPIDDVIKFYKT